MQELNIKNADTMLFIENKANYIDYIQNRKKEKEFVVYHGGMYSPIKGEFLKMLYETAQNQEFYHWSDIDIGGFKIFARLRKIIPSLKPYKMDKESFESKQAYWKKMSQAYQNQLCEMRQKEEYEVFYEVMDVMLKSGCKLEQEAFIGE